MNNVIEAQASRLADLNCEKNAMSCHLFLDNLHVPLAVQDRIVSEITKLKVSNPGNIAKVITSCYEK